MSARRFRVGVDVGGTFTDFMIADIAGSALHLHKEPSVPGDPSLAVERGVATILQQHRIAPGEIELIVHGTTIGLNAIIQRRGARVALVVSKGNRDVLEIARLRMPSSYDFTEPREAPLAPRNLVFEVGARMRADGSVETPVDRAEVAAVAAGMKARGVEAVAVMLLNSYRNPSLEIEVAGLLRAGLPDALISESGVIWPEVREYERCLVAGLNAYIHPLMTRYFDRLSSRVSKLGVAAPIYITANNGGTLGLATARSRPIDTVLSGPASGVVASTRIGAAAAQPRLITLDMGGTSADIAICERGVPEFATTTFVGDFPLMMPVVNVGAIGAGGGSILWVDAQGFLKVGPLSAGADPGPACYGRGGVEATVTDCYVTLGVIDPDRFLGGRMTLDHAAALAALSRIATKLGLSGPQPAIAAAEAGLRVASAKMATEIAKLIAQAGVDPRRLSLVAYGGAGPTHANLLARDAGLNSVLVPMAPGAFCALGAILADVRRDYVRTARRMIGAPGVLVGDKDGWLAVAALIADLQSEAADWIAGEGDLIGAHDFVVTANMRYPAQADEIAITVAHDSARPVNSAALAGLFHAEHRRLYGFDEPDSPIQITTVRLGVIGRVAPLSLPSVASRPVAPSGMRRVWIDGAHIETRIYDRAMLGEGAVIEGPAVIEQTDTTSFILPDWRATADAIGTLHVTRGGAP